MSDFAETFGEVNDRRKSVKTSRRITKIRNYHVIVMNDAIQFVVYGIRARAQETLEALRYKHYETCQSQFQGFEAYKMHVHWHISTVPGRIAR